MCTEKSPSNGYFSKFLQLSIILHITIHVLQTLENLDEINYSNETNHYFSFHIFWYLTKSRMFKVNFNRFWIFALQLKLLNEKEQDQISS